MFMSPAVIRKAARECHKQKTGPLEVFYLTDTLAHAVRFTHEPITPALLDTFAEMIEPEKNRNGVRHTPVSFDNFGSSASHHDIPRLLDTWCGMVSEMIVDDNVLMDAITVKKLIHEFLWIHPYKDGNGRLAFVLYNLLCGFAKFFIEKEQTLMFVYPLPDFDWN